MELPPLNLSFPTSSALQQQGAAFMASGPGNWDVSFGSAGPVAIGASSAAQTATAAPKMPRWVWVAAAVGAAWLLIKH